MKAKMTSHTLRNGRVLVCASWSPRGNTTAPTSFLQSSNLLALNVAPHLVLVTSCQLPDSAAWSYRSVVPHEIHRKYGVIHGELTRPTTRYSVLPSVQRASAKRPSRGNAFTRLCSQRRLSIGAHPYVSMHISHMRPSLRNQPRALSGSTAIAQGPSLS